MKNFYDKVAKKFGGYAYGSNKPAYTSQYPTLDPEDFFKKKLISIADKNSVALDVGCGDGKFTFEVAKYFSKIKGADSSKELIQIAQKKKKELQISNIDFSLQNARKMSFPSFTFNVVFNRRGPNFYKEYYRILKKNGYYLEIGIGEEDAMELKKVFKRGQGYNAWQKPRIDIDRKVFKKLGFIIVLAKSIMYSELYASEKSFVEFLEGVPIFEDFDSIEDRLSLNNYFKKYKRNGKVLLGRQRIIYLLQK